MPGQLKLRLPKSKPTSVAASPPEPAPLPCSALPSDVLWPPPVPVLRVGSVCCGGVGRGSGSVREDGGLGRRTGASGVGVVRAMGGVSRGRLGVGRWGVRTGLAAGGAGRSGSGCSRASERSPASACCGGPVRTGRTGVVPNSISTSRTSVGLQRLAALGHDRKEEQQQQGVNPEADAESDEVVARHGRAGEGVPCERQHTPLACPSRQQAVYRQRPERCGSGARGRLSPRATGSGARTCRSRGDSAARSGARRRGRPGRPRSRRSRSPRRSGPR